MELIDIIIYVLQLFALSSLGILSISYVVFKIKDNKRLKPYEKLSKEVLRPSSLPPKTKVDEEELVPSPKLNKNVSKKKIDKKNEEVQEEIKFNPDYNKPEYRFTGRFKVVNEQVKNSVNKKESEFEKVKTDYKPEEKPQPIPQLANNSNGGMNIYNYYSDNRSRAMHKLKLSPATRSA